MNEFQRIFDLGYRLLVPVIPFDAELSPRTKIRPEARGKAVGTRGTGGLWYGFDWSVYRSDEYDVKHWHEMGASVGIRTGEQPDGSWLVAIDADTRDEGLAKIIRDQVLAMAPNAPIRVGRAPKALYLVRCRSPMTYSRIDFGRDADGKPERVELLSDKRQFVASGIHPGTLRPYEWTVPLVRFDDLPVIDAATLERLLTDLRALLPACSPIHVEGGGEAVAQETLRAPSVAIVRQAVAALPNDARFPTRESYVGIGFAIKASLPDAPDEAYDIWAGPGGWCQRWLDGDNDPETNASDWGRMKPPFKRGWSWLSLQAENHSGGVWSRAAEWFDPTPPVIEENLFPEVPRVEPASVWPEPVDLFGIADPLELGTPPVGSLPEIIRAVAEDEARRKGVSLAFAATAIVGAVGAAIGAALHIRPRRHDTGWEEPAALWVALVAASGSGKSPVISAAVRPLANIDKRRGGADYQRHAAWRKADAAHRKKKDAPDPGPEPVIRRYVVDDVTMEKLVGILADNPRGVLRAPDELAGFLASFGLYKKSGDADRSQALRLFDGGPITVDRVGTGSTRAAHALIGVLAGTQPDKIGALTSDLGDDGMLQRIIFVMDDGVERQGLDVIPDEKAAARYRQTVEALVSTDLGFVVPQTADARAVLAEADRKISELKHLPGASTAWQGHISKWGKFLSRLALIFHAVEGYDAFGVLGIQEPLGAETAAMAASFAQFLVGHALHFYETFYGASASASEAKGIAGWLLVRPDLKSVTQRDVYDARKDLRGAAKRPALLAAMGELEMCGWVSVADRRPGEGPTRWTVNPKIRTHFAAHAAREKVRREREREKIEKAAAARRGLAGSA